MFSLTVLQHLDHPDGRIFEVGHDCKSLSPFEAAELVYNYPDYFKAGDAATEEFLANTENVKHLAEAAARQRTDAEAQVTPKRKK